MSKSEDVIGLIPAAGYAKRISPLPCSKEIYPIMHPDGTSRVVSSYLLESFRKANIKQTYLILRAGKWDIPEFFKNGESVGLDLAYIVSEATRGVPQTINKAYSFINKNRVVFGFPDILFRPSDAFSTLLEKQETSSADLVLGLFEAANPSKMDMVDFDSEGVLRDVIIKPDKTNLTYTWIIAVWTPAFTNYLNKYLEEVSKEKLPESESANSDEELHIGHIFREAIQAGFKTAYVKFDGTYLDIGTPSELKKANNMEWLRSFNSNA